MSRTSFLSVFICFICIFLIAPMTTNGAQLQIFGVSSIDGVLSLDYEHYTQTYPSQSVESSSLSQNYELQVGTFVLHPKFLAWNFAGDFGITRSGNQTSLNNRSYGMSVRLLRDFFISAGAGYNLGQETISVPYAPSYTRDREEKSAEVSVRLRHFPTTFSFQSLDLDSDAAGHAEDSTENRLGLTTNIWFGQGLRGSLRVNSVDKTDRLALVNPDTSYYNASLSNSWHTRDRRISWTSGVQLYRKELPDKAETMSVSESLNYRGNNGLGGGASFSFSKNLRETYEEQRLGGSWKLKYDFSEVFSGQIKTGVNKFKYDRFTGSDYLQDRYNFEGQLNYKVEKDGLTYYATGTAGYLQRIVEGEGQITTTELVQFDPVTKSAKLSHSDVTDVEKLEDENQTLTYADDTWDFDYESQTLYIIISERPDGGDDTSFIPPDAKVWVTYTYIPQQDDKQVSGRVKVGLDKDLAENVTLTSYATAGMARSLLSGDSDPTLNHELYLGTKIDHNYLTFTGSVSNSDQQNKITGEAKYEHGGLSVKGTYAAELPADSDPRHNLSLSGRYYTYIPVGLRLTLQASEQRVYRSGQLLNGDFNLSANARYPLRRFMWLRDELKFNIDHTYDNSLRWSNLVGFEWKQGMLSLNSGYELVGNRLTGYRSGRFTVKMSRKF